MVSGAVGRQGGAGEQRSSAAPVGPDTGDPDDGGDLGCGWGGVSQSWHGGVKRSRSTTLPLHCGRRPDTRQSSRSEAAGGSTQRWKNSSHRAKVTRVWVHIFPSTWASTLIIASNLQPPRGAGEQAKAQLRVSAGWRTRRPQESNETPKKLLWNALEVWSFQTSDNIFTFNRLLTDSF